MLQADIIERRGRSAVSPEKPLLHQRLVWLFVILALLRGLVYTALIPPWQSPDEPGHLEYAWLVSQHGPLVGPGAISPAFQQEVLASMARFDFWRLAHQPIPETLPASLTDSSDPLLSASRPQVGDERPLYYAMVGFLLRLAGVQDVLAMMYIGRAVSVLLLAAAAGVAALTTRRLFPTSFFMQTVPPALFILLPMLGQMGAAANSDALGVLTGTLFFATLVPIFRDGLTWRRGGALLGAIVLALLSKKTTLFLLPTALAALPIYGWTRDVRLSRRIGRMLAAGAALLLVAVTILALLPGADAAGWVEWSLGCGPTRSTFAPSSGEAALRVAPCGEGMLVQSLPPESVAAIAGQRVTLSGQVRSAGGPAEGQAMIWEGAEQRSTAHIAVSGEWQPFSVTHTLSANAMGLSVRLSAAAAGVPLLFDNLTLTTGAGEDLLVNGSAEGREPLLLDLLSDVARAVGAPRRLVERVLSPASWGPSAWRGYLKGALFCFHSFWGNFGWLAVPLPQVAYRLFAVACLLALVGNLLLLFRRRRGWRQGYLWLLTVALLLLAAQTLLPLVGMRGTIWLPQGRYLFPGLFVIAILLAWGFHNLLPGRVDRWSAVAGVTALAAFDGLCLVGLILPHFYL